MKDKISVLFDTDIGSDIDDAVALAYLLMQPQCDLVGITTVTGDVRQRAALAQVLCSSVHRDVPIHCGRRDVLVNGKGQPFVPQYDTIKDQPHRLAYRENTAVEFMQKTIRRRPGEIVLLSVGPFSNVALLFALDPEIPSLLRGLVSMAGIFFRPGAREWNVLCDPVASSMVYASKRSHHISVGLDVTEKCRLSAAEVGGRFVGEPLSTVKTFAAKWFQNASEIVFHDPLTAVLLFHPEICEYKNGRVVVPLNQDENAAGITEFVEGEGPDQVASAVDAETFFARYFEVFKG